MPILSIILSIDLHLPNYKDFFLSLTPKEPICPLGTINSGGNLGN